MGEGFLWSPSFSTVKTRECLEWTTTHWHFITFRSKLERLELEGAWEACPGVWVAEEFETSLQSRALITTLDCGHFEHEM